MGVFGWQLQSMACDTKENVWTCYQRDLKLGQFLKCLLILEHSGIFWASLTLRPKHISHWNQIMEIHGQNVYWCEKTPSSPYPCLGHQPPRTLKFWWKSSIEVAMDQWKIGRTVRVGVGSVRWSNHQVTCNQKTPDLTRFMGSGAEIPEVDPFFAA